MPKFIQAVVDYKSFVKGYIHNGFDRIMGLGEMHLFKFYVDEEGWSVMQFRELAIDAHSLPRQARYLYLEAGCGWKSDDTFQSPVSSSF